MLPDQFKSPKRRPVLRPPQQAVEPINIVSNSALRDLKDQQTESQKKSESDLELAKAAKYKKSFDGMRVYFDGVPLAIAKILKPKLERLGATLEQYLSFRVKLLVTDNPEFIDDRKFTVLIDQ